MVRIVKFAVFLCVIASPVLAEWNISEFMIYGSWPWDRSGKTSDEERAKTLVKAGINCVLAKEDHLDMLESTGLTGLVEHIPPEEIGRIKDHPALYGYYIMDEPLHNFHALKKIYDAYYEADPTKPGFINLISLGGDYLTSFMDTVQPNILSYDYYQYWWGRDGHFTKLEQYGKSAKDAGVPMFLYTEVNTSPYGTFGGPKNIRPPDNEERLRHSVFTALPYGLKGVLWFTAGTMFEPETAKLSDCGKDVTKVNKVLKVLGPTLVKLRPVDVYHTAPLPRGVKEVPDDYWLQPTSHISYGVVMGTFKDGEDIDYVIIANKNDDIEMRVALEIARKVPVEAVHGLDKTTGEWVEIPVTEMVAEENRGKYSWAYDMHEYSSRTTGTTITYKDIRDKWHVYIEGKQYVEFELDRADVQVLRIKRDMSFETIRQQKAAGKKF